MKFAATVPRVAATVRKDGEKYRKDLRRAAIIATDKASKDAQRAVQQRIRSVGLGRLGGAVGQTSMLKERSSSPTDNPYGVIFARGGDESQAGGTLEAYSQGATIKAQQQDWLAIATNAVPKFITISGRRFRTTPQLYKNSLLASSIGKLVFKPIGPGRALLVLRKGSVSPKTGRAKAFTGKERSRVVQKDIVLFILIKVTVRAKRFDKDSIVLVYAKAMPRYITDALAQIRGN